MNSSTRSDTIRVPFLRDYHEYALFNIDDVDPDYNGNAAVVAQGQQSGRYYILTLDESFSVIHAGLY